MSGIYFVRSADALPSTCTVNAARAFRANRQGEPSQPSAVRCEQRCSSTSSFGAERRSSMALVGCCTLVLGSRHRHVWRTCRRTLRSVGTFVPRASDRIATVVCSSRQNAKLKAMETASTSFADEVQTMHRSQRLGTAESSRRRHAPCQEGDVLRLEIESLTSHGQGLGRYGPSRWVIMTYGALPNETVDVEVVRHFRGYSEGRLKQVIRPSDDRVTPKCAVFQRCSGCQYQHLAYQSQLEWKRKHVYDAFTRIARLPLSEDVVKPTVPSPLEYHYRTKLTPHFQDPHRGHRRRREDVAGTLPQANIGFLEEDWGEDRDRSGRRWKRVVDVEQCPIATEAINAALPTLRERALQSAASQKQVSARSRQLLLRDTTNDGIATDGASIVTEELPGLGAFYFRAGGFFQNNSSILPAFVSFVVDAAVEGCSSDLGNSDHGVLVDLYCGVGLFAIAAGLRARFDGVFGVEVDDIAVKLARKNALRNGLADLSFTAADAGDGFRWVAAKVGAAAIRAGVVIVDPPRQGLSSTARDALLEWRPRRIVYVSCDCATQARDLLELTAAGYEIRSATPFDLFPQTRHLEVVAILEQVSSQMDRPRT